MYLYIIFSILQQKYTHKIFGNEISSDYYYITCSQLPYVKFIKSNILILMTLKQEFNNSEYNYCYILIPNRIY